MDHNTQHWQSSSPFPFSSGESAVPHFRYIASYRKAICRNQIEVDKFALNLLPNILKKAARIPELGKVLQTHLLRTPNYRLSAESSKAAKAIKEYLEVCAALPRPVPSR